MLKYIINSKVPKENGVRQLRKSLEKLFNKINYLLLTGNYKKSSLIITLETEKDLELNTITKTEIINISKKFIDESLESIIDLNNTSYLQMYI